MIDNEKFYKVSDYSHCCFSIAVLYTALLFGNVMRGIVISTALVFFAIFKEFYWDIYFETKDEAGSGLRDFVGYLAGLSIGWGFFFLFHK